MTPDERKMLHAIVKAQPDEGCVMPYDLQKQLLYNKDMTSQLKIPFPAEKSREIMLKLSEYGDISYCGKSRAVIHHHAYHTKALFAQRIGEFLLRSILVPIAVAVLTALSLHLLGL